MADTNEQDFDRRLLDLHLGHLSEAEQVRLRGEIASDPRLAAEDRALSGVFEALNAVPQESVPADLAARATARVRAAGPSPRIVRPTDELTAAVERGAGRVIRLGNLRDIVAVAALIVLAVGIGVPSVLHVRERAQRHGCSQNLASLGFGLQQYANAFGSSFPFAGWSGRENTWQPSSDSGMVSVPNRRHVYPLLRMKFVADPRVFICPSQQHVPMPQAAVAERDDFLESRNVSYVYQNMAGVRPSANDDPDLPIMADDNPLFANGLPLFEAARRLGSRDPFMANSHAHRAGGQNILTLGGYVKWTTTPCSGVGDDNIWTLDGVTNYTGQEGPTTPKDSHLIK